MSERKENAMRNGQDGLDRQDGRKEKFTPRPWRVHRDKRNGTVCAIIEDKSGDCVARTVYRFHRGERNANGHLITAAPDMYVSLKDMVLTVTDLLEAICSGEENTDCLFAVVQDEIDNAIKVLKKARGEENV